MEDNALHIVFISANNNMRQTQVSMCHFLPEPPHVCLPVWPLSAVTEHWVELPMPHSKSPLALHITYNDVYVSILFSSFAPPSPPSVSTSLFPMSASPLLPCKWIHQYHLFRFHMHALIYNIYLSLFDYTLCNRF